MDVSPEKAGARTLNRFYVGGIPGGATEIGVRDAFAAVGVEVGFIDIVLNTSTGLSRGFAFVHFPGGVERSDGAAFLAQLRSAQVDGHTITIACIPEVTGRPCGTPKPGPS
jgi:hypothetical protein